MSLVQINPLWNFDTLNVFHPNRFKYGVNRVLILEILVELTIGAQVVVGAGPKSDTVFEMVQAGAPMGGPPLEFV
jgi:hypothetical protein